MSEHANSYVPDEIVLAIASIELTKVIRIEKTKDRLQLNKIQKVLL